MNWKYYFYLVSFPVWWVLNKIPIKNIGIRGKLIGNLTLSQCAWNKDYDPAYRFTRLGIPLKELPKRVILGGIAHRVYASEGMVVFSQEAGFYGTHQRICFERGSDGMLWYLKFSETWDKVPMAHVKKAYQFVEEVYGKDFVIKKEVK